MPEYAEDAKTFPVDEVQQMRLFRSLVNLRPPRPISDEFLQQEAVFLQEEAKQKGIVHIDQTSQLVLWQGDITRLAVDAIVNAGNSALLGCFHPCHGCIDNAIHTYAGVELRLLCNELMVQQGHKEKTGQAKITKAFHLPSKYILHTVGPIVHGELTKAHREDLRNCYLSCLQLAEENHLESIAFCCISTGEFHFPNEAAAEIAVATVKDFLKTSRMQVVFNVFKDEDYKIYEKTIR
ncbi:MAG: protein-ADP-ribose hydrolase [Bacillota bacterium]